MEPVEDVSASLAPAPVFVDDTGRRRALTRRAGRIVVIGFAAYIGLMVVGFARDPRVGPIHLPTFGLPSLGLVVPPAPSVLGAQTSRPDESADGEVATDDGPATPARTTDRPARSEPAPGGAGSGTGAAGPDLVTSTSGGASQPGPRLAPAGNPAEPATTTTSATTTTTTRGPGQGAKSSTTTTSTTATSTTTSTTTTTPASEPGQGSGQGSGQGTGPVSAKGPDGSGAPGQQRRTTTTTAS